MIPATQDLPKVRVPPSGASVGTDCITQITLALTTFNRFEMLTDTVSFAVNDSRIGEVVISDDHSTDGSYERLEWRYGCDPKIRLSQNAKNLDCYRNKREAVAMASLPWVILFDSDNVIGPDYLDALYGLQAWLPNVAYLPVFAKPHFDYRQFAGLTVTRMNVHNFAGNQTFMTALNTANYFVRRDRYLETFDLEVEPHTADSIWMNYRWLRDGGVLHFVPGLEYEHRVHADSHYKKNVHKTGKFHAEVERLIRALK